MSELDKINKIMIDIATLITKMDMVTEHIKCCSNTPVRVSLLEESMNGVKRILWGIGGTVGTALVCAVLALILI